MYTTVYVGFVLVENGYQMGSISDIMLLYNVLDFSGFNLDLFGQPVMAHFCALRSMPAQLQNLSILYSWVCIDWRVFVYGAVVIFIFDVPDVKPLLPLCRYLNNSSRNIMNRYGLSVSPWMVPLWIGIGFVVPKFSLVNIVDEFTQMFPINVTASTRYLRSFIIARSWAWSRDPNAFLKSIYNMQICGFVRFASSRAAMIHCICLAMLLFAQNLS